MARDEKETGDEETHDPASDETREKEEERPSSPPVPSDKAEKAVKEGAVAKALRKAREAADADRKRKAGRWLAIVPVAAALFSFFIMMPREAEPSAVPLPYVDERVLRAIRDADEARAKEALANRLPTDVLELGTAIRALNAPRDEDNPNDTMEVKSSLFAAVRRVLDRPDGAKDILKLRALQTHTFVEELTRFESSGEESAELRGLAGEFVERMRGMHWIVGHELVLDDWQRRVAYKAMWTRLSGLDGDPQFKLVLDEERALYGLYIRHPHPPESRREELDGLRRSALQPDACKRAALEEKRATELWRADKIRMLGTIDPTYPTHYALGVAYYRAGRFDLATDSFRAWIDRHPDGALTIRARNHLKASLATYGTL